MKVDSKTAGWVTGIVLIGGTLALLASLLPDPLAVHPEQRMQLLTDNLGRSILSRLAHGVGNSVVLVLLILIPTLLISVPAGLWAASDRRIAAFLDTLAGAVWSLPTIIVGLVVFATLEGRYVEVKYVALGFFNWVPIYRAVRDMTREVRESSYYEFGRMLGFSSPALATYITWPNVWPEVFPVIMLNVATLFEAEFVLGFLGLSYPSPTATLGSMLHRGLEYVHPPLVLLPSLVIALLVGGALFMGRTTYRNPSD